MSRRDRRLAQQAAGRPPNQGNISVQYAGPLPPAGQYHQYERTLPGSANRILAMAEKEQAHRHQLEPVLQNDQRRIAFRGQWVAAVLSVLFGVGSVYLGMNGHDIPAGILGGTTAVSIVSIFVLRRR